MKVWEKVAEKFPDNKFTGKTQVEDGMYCHRWLPCDCNDEHSFITEARMNKLCEKNEMDCKKCLKSWLGLEV